MSIKIVKKVDYSKVDFVICSDKDMGLFDDNKRGYCSECGKELAFRPYVPDDVGKIHESCLSKLLEKENGNN